METRHSNSNLNHKVTANLTNVKLSLLFLPTALLVVVILFLLKERSFSVAGYIDVQKELFLYLNGTLAKNPVLQDNLTQLGDVAIFFPLITIFIIYAPKLWEALLTSAIISLIVSAALKKIFAVPRPAAVFDHDSFTIIGETLAGHTSLPSGHSIATFVVISTLLFAFAPLHNTFAKILWSIFLLTIGLFIASSRVGVGAHYPLDVVVGSTLGYMITVVGTVINNKTNWWAWIRNRKYLPIFMLLFVVLGGAIVKKIIDDNLFIYYLALFSLVITFYFMVRTYVEKKH